MCCFQPTLSNHRDQYNVSWGVESFAPILEYRLFYRKQSENSNANHNNNDVLHYDKFVSHNNMQVKIYCIWSAFLCIYTQILIINLIRIISSRLQTNTHGNSVPMQHYHIHERHPEWENIVIPQLPAQLTSQMHQSHTPQYYHSYQPPNIYNARHKMSYLIRNLTPASNYEARVQARNDHGWNKLSSTFHFSTRAEGKCHYFAISWWLNGRVDSYADVTNDISFAIITRMKTLTIICCVPCEQRFLFFWFLFCSGVEWFDTNRALEMDTHGVCFVRFAGHL